MDALLQTRNGGYMRKIWRLRKFIIAIFFGLTVLFGYGALLGISGNQEEASTDPPGRVFDLQEKVDKQFPPEIYAVPYELFNEKEGNVLTKKTLAELKDKLDALRNSELGQEFLVPFRDPQIGKTGTLGFYTIADAVDAKLHRQGTSLESASPAKVEQVIGSILNADNAHADFFHLRLSSQAYKTDEKWVSPLYEFFIRADSNKLGGGYFRRTLGGTEDILQKEKFNREIEKHLYGEEYNLLGVGIDLNLEAEEEGFSTPILLRNVGLLAALAVLTGLLMRSLRIGFIAFVGLSALLVWIMGFPGITAGLIKPSITTKVILPMAFMALGIDSYLYVIRRYEQERSLLLRDRAALRRAFIDIGAILLLAAVTDAVAFGANGISNVEAIRSFAFTGIFSAFAAFFIMGIVMPIILVIRDKQKERPRKQLTALSIAPVFKTIYRFRFIVILALAGLTVVSVFGISRVERSIGPSDFLMQDSNFVQSLDLVDDHLGDRRGEEAFIYAYGKDLRRKESQNAIGATLDNLKENPFLGRDSNENLVMPYGKPDITEVEDGNEAMRIGIEILDTKELKNVTAARKQLERDLRPLRRVTIDYGITGPPFTREASLNAVTNEPIKTGALAVGIILFLLWTVSGSFRFSVKTLIPMVLVVVWTYGFMGWFGFDLNFITATIAAVGLGIGVDYSLHITYSFKRSREKGYRNNALFEVVGKGTGLASLAAAISSIIGFAVLATAPMPLFATYGILGMAIIAFSFCASILTAPLTSTK